MTLALNMNESAPFFHVKCESRRFWKEEEKSFPFRAVLCSPCFLFFAFLFYAYKLYNSQSLPTASTCKHPCSNNEIKYSAVLPYVANARALWSSLCFHFISTGCFGSFEAQKSRETFQSFPIFPHFKKKSQNLNQNVLSLKN